MKRVFTIGILIIAVIFYIFFSGSYYDYKWSFDITKEQRAEGREVVEVKRIRANPARIWTYLIKPITRITFIKPADIKLINGYLAAESWKYDYYFDNTEISHAYNLFDCVNNKLGVTFYTLNNVFTNLDQIEWYGYDERPSFKKLIEGVCKHKQ